MGSSPKANFRSAQASRGRARRQGLGWGDQKTSPQGRALSPASISSQVSGLFVFGPRVHGGCRGIESGSGSSATVWCLVGLGRGLSSPFLPGVTVLRDRLLGSACELSYDQKKSTRLQ
uniref:Tumor protein p53 regulated apoptosis inducing protein 1 n=1 Tax=Aotus nancymaae TaxID=37293 RepID=A0A2K5CPH3_AOTNA